MLENPLQEFLNTTFTRLAIVFLLSYLYLALVENADSFQARPSCKGICGILCGSACRAGMFPAVGSWPRHTARHIMVEGGDGECRKERGTQDQMSVEMLSRTGPFQNRGCTTLFPLGTGSLLLVSEGVPLLASEHQLSWVQPREKTSSFASEKLEKLDSIQIK